MKGKILKCFFASLFCFFLLGMNVANICAAEKTIGVEELRVGMKGIARTVVLGTKIDTFNVEVLGILKNAGPSGDLVLIRTSGRLIDKIGGIAQGMSGSPVYFNGRLAGAVSFGMAFSDHHIGMMTPIRDMLKIWEIETKSVNVQNSLNPLLEEKERLKQEEDNKDSNKKNQQETMEKQTESTLENKVDKKEDTKSINREMSTPFLARGFSERALKFLQDKMPKWNVLAGDAYGADTTGITGGNLEPGSAVAAQLLRGDLDISAIGTVTYVDNGKILAFGHPFLQKGSIDFMMSDAYIYTVVSSVNTPFKMGVPGKLIGTFNQDRGAGIAGMTNKYPGILPIRVTVRDVDTGAVFQYGAQSIVDEELSPIIATASLINFIDKTVDRIGRGTVRIGFVISARNLPGEEIIRENMFYAPEALASTAVNEFFEYLAILMNNPYKKIDVFDININVDATSDCKAALILSAKAEKMDVHAGETVNIEVKLKPYRGKDFKQTVNFVIPKEQPPGPLSLVVRGGSIMPFLKAMEILQVEEDNLMSNKKNKIEPSFELLVHDLQKRDRNNDIVVELLPMDSVAIHKLVKKDIEGVKKNQTEKALQAEKIMQANNFNKPWLDLFVSKDDGKAEPNLDQEKRKESAIDILRAIDKIEKNKTFYTTTTDYIIDGDTEVTINVVPTPKVLGAQVTEGKKTEKDSAKEKKATDTKLDNLKENSKNTSEVSDNKEESKDVL